MEGTSFENTEIFGLKEFTGAEELAINNAVEEARDNPDRVQYLNQVGQLLTFATALAEGVDTN